MSSNPKWIIRSVAAIEQIIDSNSNVPKECHKALLGESRHPKIVK